MAFQEKTYSFSANTSPHTYANVTTVADCADRCVAQPGCVYFNHACCGQKLFGSGLDVGNCQLAGNGSAAAMQIMPNWWPLFAGIGAFASAVVV